MPIQKALKRLLAGALVSTASCLMVAAQTSAESASGYDQPPKEILDVMHAPSPPAPQVSPTEDNILLVSWEDYPSIARVSTPFLRLAGVRVEPKNHSKHDTPGGYGITRCARGFELVHVANGAAIRVAIPKGGCPGRPTWSADGMRFAFVNLASDSVELWIGEAKSGAVHQVAGVRLNPMLDREMQ
jgi:dipeptidyl aminopeptidase/acylaminoacyl peptidase